tara:strand:- start:2452 stop:3219 length:768 start_codon:yes stop_codon:yes gene_type:complete
MRLISYIRVSSESQADNQSPKTQQEINNHTLLVLQDKQELPEGLRINEDISDIGVSGLTEFKDRPQGKNLNTLDEGDCIFISSVDRLARDNRILESFLHDCKVKGINIFCANTGNITLGVNAQKKLEVSMTAVFSEYMASQIKKNVRRGKDSKRGVYHLDEEIKGYIGGKPNWGYKIVGEGKSATIVKEVWRDDVLKFIQSLSNGNVSTRRIQSECIERFGEDKTPASHNTIAKLIMNEEAIKNYEESLTIRQEV